MTARPRRAVRLRGGPLVMLLVLLTSWGTARAMLWENPLAPLGQVRDQPLTGFVPAHLALAPGQVGLPSLPLPVALQGIVALDSRSGARRAGARLDPRLAATQRPVWYAALRELPVRGDGAAEAAAAPSGSLEPRLVSAPFLPEPTLPPGSTASGRWSANAWAFWRQGSDAAPISQGRVPVYGASQAGAVLQYRLAPDSTRDPRLYARAYRALVRRGEQELALGASARPIGRMPLRVAGEVRYTDGAFSNALRPAAYAVTELAPFSLPLGARLEAYGQAGYVGGPGATAFADGQASVTRELRQLAGLTDNAVRVSLGAAAWGGAQKDAERIDIGPTMRFDLTIGAVPARLSVDWRERVGGDAGPDSGVAATLSTQF